MAYVSPTEQQNIVPVAPGQPGNNLVTGGAGVVGTKQATNVPGQSTPQQPSASLQSYLSSNVPQTQAFANQIAGNLGNQVGQAANAILPAVNAYTGNLYTVPTDTTVNNQVSTAPSQLTPQQTSTYNTELQAAANVPNSANTFETTAPYADMTSQIQSAVQNANLWNSGNNVANLQTAVQPYESTNNTGNTTLDALLLSQNQPAYSTITNAGAPAANLQGQLNTGAQTADTALQNAIAQDQAATAAATAAPQTYATNLTNNLQSELGNIQGTNTAQNQQILTDLTNNTPTPADLTTLGVTPAQWTTLDNSVQAANNVGYPVNLSSYLAQVNPNTAVTIPNLATSQNYSDVAALQNLLGSNAPIEPITATTANQAGSAPTSFNTFNLPAAQEAATLSAQVGGLEQQAQAVQSQATYASQQYDINHFGGQSPEQFNNYIAGLNAQLNSINSQITNILAQAPTLNAPTLAGNTGVEANSPGLPDILKQIQNNPITEFDPLSVLPDLLAKGVESLFGL